MGRSRYTIYENQAPHFLTCTVNNWIPIFTRPATVQVILEALAYRQEQRCLKIYAFESRRWRVLSGIPTRRAGTRWVVFIWFPRAAREPSADAPASRSAMSSRCGLHSHSHEAIKKALFYLELAMGLEPGTRSTVIARLLHLDFPHSQAEAWE